MPNPIFARVELHEKAGAKPDYDVLRQNMAEWKFSHMLTTNGVRELLPTGLYARVEPIPIDLAKDMVQLAADKTGFTNCGVVTGDEGFRTFTLKRALPPLSWLKAKAASMQPPPGLPPLAPRGLYSGGR